MTKTPYAGGGTAVLGGYYLAPAARADLCRRLGRVSDAAVSYRRALTLTRQAPERRFLDRFVDDPFAEIKALIAGYTLIQANSREEALEGSRLYPNPAGAGLPGEIEVRQLFELEDFEPSEAIDRCRDLREKSHG